MEWSVPRNLLPIVSDETIIEWKNYRCFVAQQPKESIELFHRGRGLFLLLAGGETSTRWAYHYHAINCTKPPLAIVTAARYSSAIHPFSSHFERGVYCVKRGHAYTLSPFFSRHPGSPITGQREQAG